MDDVHPMLGHPDAPDGADWFNGMSPETFVNPAVSGLLGGLATLPQRAIENSQHSLNTGTYDPGPTLEAATLPMGTGAIAGVPVRAGEKVLGSGAVRGVKSGMDAPSELYHVVGPEYAEGSPLQSLHSRLGDKAYDEFAKRWPDAGDLALDHPHKTFFYSNAKEAAQHADDFGGKVLRVDPSKVPDLYWDKLENPGYWTTKADVPPDALSPFAKANNATAGVGPAASIRAYHGSPHDFDKFDLSKIGTGEGAQAYGHGLYFAENEGTAKSYRDALSRPTQESPLWKLNGEPVDRGTPHWPLADALDNMVMKQGEKIPDALKRRIDELEGHAGFASKAYGQSVGEMYLNKADKLKSIDPNSLTYHPPGKMYEVNINADPEHFLDWDKPLSEQHPKVQEAFRSVGVDPAAPNLRDQVDAARGLRLYPPQGGSAVYPHELPDMKSPQATAALSQAGIPGIKYLDQGSRAAGDGSRNYVVFNDKLIDIMRKYAVPGMFGGLMGAPIFGNQQKQ